MNLSYFVVYVRDVELSKRFYETLGFLFAKEKHGKGPVHYSHFCQDIGVTFELYPQTEFTISPMRLGFDIVGLEDRYQEALAIGGSINKPWRSKDHSVTLNDPDGHALDLKEIILY
jgi:lactoylglutathione lyase